MGMMIKKDGSVMKSRALNKLENILTKSNDTGNLFLYIVLDNVLHLLKENRFSVVELKDNTYIESLELISFLEGSEIISFKFYANFGEAKKERFRNYADMISFISRNYNSIEFIEGKIDLVLEV